MKRMIRIIFFCGCCDDCNGLRDEQDDRCGAQTGARAHGTECEKGARRQILHHRYDLYPAVRVATRHLDGGYYLHISGDSIYSCLPYVGRAFNVPYGGGVGLDFDGVMQQYKESRASDNKGTKIDIVVTNTEDRYQYLLYVGDDGHATLNIYPSSRESISFDGEMNFD